MRAVLDAVVHGRPAMLSDDTVVVRHPELQPLIAMTERSASDLHPYAG